MDEQTSGQKPEPVAQNNTPAPARLSGLQKDLIISACVGFLCAGLILPIAKNLNLKPGLVLGLFVFLPVLSAAGMRLAYWLAQRFKIFYQLAKYALVGAFNTFFDWGILNLLMFLTSVSAGYLYSIFKGVSFLAAMIGSYLWNKFWTFKKISAAGIAAGQPPRGNGKELWQFFIVSVVGFSINVGVATVLVNVLGPQFGLSREFWANVGALGGTILGICWNFLGYKLIVFKD